MDAKSLVTALKAAAEPTRLRVLLLLSRGELSVKDLTRILGQSQPRISRHLKLLAEAGLIDRVREGSWAYFHLTDHARKGWLGCLLGEAIDPADPLVARDLVRDDTLKQERVAAAQAFFRAHAGQWDTIRSLHVAEAEVEAAMADALGPGPFELLVDLGTGTGRMLELFASRYDRAIGIDASPAMLSYARARLDRAPLAKVQVRQGDIYNLGIDDQVAGAVIMHQVLHYLTDPGGAIREAARILVPGGRLVLVDFAPHELEFLRQDCAHVRLGFSGAEMAQWLKDAGLDLLRVDDLVPPADDTRDKLTVSLWVAERGWRSRSMARQAGRVPAKEEAA